MMAFPLPFTTLMRGTNDLATVSGSSQIMLNICLFLRLEPLQVQAYTDVRVVGVTKANNVRKPINSTPIKI